MFSTLYNIINNIFYGNNSIENNNIEDNIKLIKNMENNNKDEVELL